MRHHTVVAWKNNLNKIIQYKHKRNFQKDMRLIIEENGLELK